MYEYLSNRYTKVLINGFDCSKYILSISSAPLLKPDWGEIPSSPDLSLELDNFNSIFSPYSDISILYNFNLSGVKIVCYKKNLLIWDGYLSNIAVNEENKTASITGISSLQKAINKPSKFYEGIGSPAVIAMNLLTYHNIKIDEYSFGLSKDILDDIPVRVSINPDVIEWVGSLGDLLQLLSTVCVGRFYYTRNGAIGFDVFAPEIKKPVFMEIFDNNIYSYGNIDCEIIDEYRGYKVEFLYGTVNYLNEGVDISNSLQSLDFGVNSPVTVYDQATAEYSGERWLQLSRTQYYKLQLGLDNRIVHSLQLNEWLLISSDKLKIKKRLAEVIGIDESNPLFGMITIRIINE